MAKATTKTEQVPVVVTTYKEKVTGVTLELSDVEAYFLLRLLGGLPSSIPEVEDDTLRRTPYNIYLTLSTSRLEKPEGVSHSFGMLRASGQPSYSA